MYVKDHRGRYRAATDDEILRAAEDVALVRFSRAGKIEQPADAKKMLHDLLAHRTHEHFAAVMLDNRHRVIACEILFQGGIDACHVDTHTILREALVRNAAALIVGHNHPSGMTEPSVSDTALTRRLNDACKLMNIRLIDHVIVAGTAPPYSYAVAGKL